MYNGDYVSVNRTGEKALFELQQLSFITPFILVVDREANVAWASDAMIRRFNNVVGVNASQIIEMTHPRQACSLETISARQGQVCNLALRGADCAIPLVGRWLSSGHGFILLATPNPGSSDDLDRFGFEDFPENDHLVELLVARDENKRSLIDASMAAEALKQRNWDVEQARHQLDQKLRESNDQRQAILRMMKETKQAEKMLRASEERLKAILDTIHAGIVLVDIETHGIIDVNTSAAKMIGLPKEQIIGNICHKFICPAEKGKCPITDLHQKVDNSERVLLTKEGRSKPVLKTVAIVTLNGKECMLESFVDLTKQKQAEQALKETHRRLIEASHKAGMAEVASDILHNVGNVLNSINVSAHFIQERVSNSKATNLKKVASLVSDHADDLGAFFTKDERAKHIPLYLTEVAEFIVNEQSTISEKLQSLTRNVDHIKQIIKSQQGYARAGGIEMLTNIREVIEDALEINRSGFARLDVDVQLELTETPKIHIDKQSVMQILVNLIKNAKQALSESETPHKVLTIRSRRCGKERLRIEVADNGMGISEENMAKIFRHGFTTKRHGNGFGLHSSALAAKELGGSLTAHSDGPGQGAAFILELPLHSIAGTVEGGEIPPDSPKTLS